MTALPPDLGAWGDLPFWASDWPHLAPQLRGPSILPPAPDRFAALHLTQPDDVRVVILGQDPYPTPGDANGLAFSVKPGQKLPRSLNNIYKEMQADLNATPIDGDLRHWARQGVLLLNTALSVPAGAAGAHDKIGWAPLIDQILARTAQRPTAYLLWGAKAQKRAADITGAQHLKIETAHPSPLSARRGFFGSKPFSRVNAWLVGQGQSPINWAGTTEGPQ